MKVGIITPFHDLSSPYLDECLSSVDKQSHPDVLHVLVGDGVSLSSGSRLKGKNRILISLSSNIGDYGDSPRALGAIYAFSKGCDAVAFLDSDNWFEPFHISSMVKYHNKYGAAVVVSYRNIVALDGKYFGVCNESDGLIFSDTNCLFFSSAAADVATSWWTIPPEHHCIDDRIIWHRILQSKKRIARTQQASVNYRTAFTMHYNQFNEPIPAGAKAGHDIGALAPERRLLTNMNIRTLRQHYKVSDDKNLIYV